MTSDRDYYYFALRIVGNFGATIAVPVVVFVLGGQYLEQKYHFAPWGMITGFVLAAVGSGLSIYRKAKLYGAEYQKMNKK